MIQAWLNTPVNVVTNVGTLVAIEYIPTALSFIIYCNINLSAAVVIHHAIALIIIGNEYLISFLVVSLSLFSVRLFNLYSELHIKNIIEIMFATIYDIKYPFIPCFNTISIITLDMHNENVYNILSIAYILFLSNTFSLIDNKSLYILKLSIVKKKIMYVDSVEFIFNSGVHIIEIILPTIVILIQIDVILSLS